MRFQVGRCYEIKLHGKTWRFRVVRNYNNTQVIVRHCESGTEQDLNDLLVGDISEIQINEFDCTKCDGKPSVP